MSLAWAGGLWKGETPQKEEGRLRTGVLGPVVGEKPPAPGSSPSWKGPAIPDTERGEIGESVGRHASGHSPPARGAQVFPGSRSLQVNPEKGSTQQCQSDPHRSFLLPPFLAQAQASGSDEGHPGRLHLRGTWPSSVQATVKGGVVTPLKLASPGRVWLQSGATTTFIPTWWDRWSRLPLKNDYCVCPTQWAGVGGDVHPPRP